MKKTRLKLKKGIKKTILYFILTIILLYTIYNILNYYNNVYDECVDNNGYNCVALIK